MLNQGLIELQYQTLFDHSFKIRNGIISKKSRIKFKRVNPNI